MKKVRISCFTAVLTLLTVGCCALAACNEEPTNYRGLNFGKYYLATSDEVYIEIKADHEAYLHNLDFSDFNPEEYWGHYESWETEPITKEYVISAMQGERNYWYFDGADGDDKTLFFEIKKLDNGEVLGEVYGISFIYNGSDELEFEGTKYIKK